MELPGFTASCFEAVLSHFLIVGLSVLQVFAFSAVHLCARTLGLGHVAAGAADT
jgi:hypothetical protein